MYLASGGNDNKLLVWAHNAGTESQPVQTYTDHQAAVKAIAWSPHHHGLLASGGGTADRYIRFWNTLTGQALQAVDTGSQVCNLAWSKHASELVSTHGYSQNQILLWKYPSLTQIAKLTGHTYRVLYLVRRSFASIRWFMSRLQLFCVVGFRDCTVKHNMTLFAWDLRQQKTTAKHNGGLKQNFLSGYKAVSFADTGEGEIKLFLLQYLLRTFEA